MITTVTLNPMLDKTVEVDGLIRGRIHRASRVGMVVGGKGINVARQLHLLGDPAVATGFWGGEVGSTLARLLEEEGMVHEFVRIAATTREGVTYREPDGTWTAVFEPPHAVTPQEVRALVDTCAALAGRSAWVVCSGSSPCPAADDVFRQVIGGAKRSGVETVLDSYGEAFLRALDAGPAIVKINRQEWEHSSGISIDGPEGFLSAIERCAQSGARWCIVTDGPRPLFAGDGMRGYRIHPPDIRQVNPTGSGDSMIAGVLHGLLAGWPFDEALRFGVAAGAANAARWEVASVTREAIDALVPRVRLENL